MKLLGNKKMNIKKLLLITSSIFLLNSCTNIISSKNSNQNIVSDNKNNFDPSGGGVIDPKPISDPQIILENMKGKLDLAQGDFNISIELKLKPLDSITGEIPPLNGLKEIKNSIFINDKEFSINIQSEKISKDLTYSLDLVGLKKDSKIKIESKVIDKKDDLMGTKILEKIITTKNESYDLSIIIEKWW
jgi:hypothetical protein